MGLLGKFFGGKDSGKDAAQPSAPGSEFQPSENASAESGTRQAPRRELVQVVFKSAMRRHGIPSDWIECRSLPVASRTRPDGMHVQLIVRDGHEQLMAYVLAFQESFLKELAQYEPRADDWLFSLAWQFQPLPEGRARPPMPDPASWKAQAARAPSSAGRVAAGAAAATVAAPPADEDVEADLKALFAIRDAALQEAASRRSSDDPPDFEPTRPGW